jgi:hypothetical protein
VREFKESDVVRNIRSLEEFDRAWEESRKFKIELEAIDLLTERMLDQIPERKTSALFIALNPGEFVAHKSIMFWQRIISVFLRMGMRMTKLRKKKALKKIARKRKLSPEEEDFLKHA